VTPSEAEVRAAAEAVVDPDLRRPLGELGIVRSVGVKRRSLTVVLAMPVARWPAAAAVTDAVRLAVEALGGPGSARVDVEVMTDDERAALHARLAAPSGPTTAMTTATRRHRRGPRGRPRVRSATKKVDPTAS
jgi:metal-sulfur cluster biosynthetic enzyme